MLDTLVVVATQIAWLVLAAVVVAPLVYLRRRLQRSERGRLATVGVRTQAMVVEAWKDEEGCHITYEFTPAQRNEVVRKTETYEDLKRPPAQVGQEIEIAYEPFRPYYSVPTVRDEPLA